MEIGRYRSLESGSLLDRFLDWIGLPDTESNQKNLTQTIHCYTDIELIAKINDLIKQWNHNKTMSAERRIERMRTLLR